MSPLPTTRGAVRHSARHGHLSPPCHRYDEPTASDVTWQVVLGGLRRLELLRLGVTVSERCRVIDIPSLRSTWFSQNFGRGFSVDQMLERAPWHR